MFVIPMQTSTLAPTANSRELQRRIDQAISDFRRERHDVTDNDVRTALTHSLNTAGPVEGQRRAAIIVVTALGAAILVGGLAASVSRTGGDRTWVVLGIAAAAAGLVIAAIRIARRD